MSDDDDDKPAPAPTPRQREGMIVADVVTSTVLTLTASYGTMVALNGALAGISRVMQGMLGLYGGRELEAKQAMLSLGVELLDDLRVIWTKQYEQLKAEEDAQLAKAGKTRRTN